MKYLKSFAVAGMLALCLTSQAQQAKTEVSDKAPWSVRMAQSEMTRCPEAWQLDFVKSPKWGYCHGVVLCAMLNLYEAYGDKRYYDYAEQFCDTMVHDDGSITSYRPSDLSLDFINAGNVLFRIYDRTQNPKYKKALDLLRGQLTYQPRTKEGGFWHKLRYTQQMWLDGIYMASPFYTEYIRRYGQPEEFQDVIRQFAVCAKHTYDPATGLYHHAWDAARTQPWADKKTGQSPHTWGRAMGWFAMALVDVLEKIPAGTDGRDQLTAILDNVVTQIVRWQDKDSGLWYQVIDRSGDPGNYLESSVSTMFVYTLYKAVRLGLIDRFHLDAAERGYKGILDKFIKVDKDGVVSITTTCAVAGLGGNPYRSGDYEYYISEPVRDNDPKAVGPFINLCLERERLQADGGR